MMEEPEDQKPKTVGDLPTIQTPKRHVSSTTAALFGSLLALQPPSVPGAPQYSPPGEDAKLDAAKESFFRHCENHPPCFKVARPHGNLADLCPRGKRLFARTQT